MRRESYQNHRVAGSEGKNISARDHSRASGFELGLGIINNIISIYQTVRYCCFLGGSSIYKDRSITAPDKTVMKVHAKQARGNGWIGLEMRLDSFLNNGFSLRTCTRIEANPSALALHQCSGHGEPEKEQCGCMNQGGAH